MLRVKNKIGSVTFFAEKNNPKRRPGSRTSFSSKYCFDTPDRRVAVSDNRMTLNNKVS